MQISSAQNPRVKQLIRLRERRERNKSDLFLIEGYRELLRASEKSLPIEALYICPALFLGENEPALIERLKSLGAQVFECSESVFRKVSYRERPDGLLALAPQMHQPLTSIKWKNSAPFLVVAEAIEKPGNLGTILRSSDAVGTDGVIVCDRCTDIHNPNVVRASVGTLFTQPVIESSSEACLQWMREHQIQVVAATPSAEKVYTEVDFSGPIAIAVGTEQLGLSDFWMSQADLQVRIPMRGRADSLNVATATTLLLYEVLRQRS